MASLCGICACTEKKYFSRLEPTSAEKIATWAVVFFILSGAAFGLLHGFEISQYALVTYFTGGISLLLFILSCIARSYSEKKPPAESPLPPIKNAPTTPFKPIPETLASPTSAKLEESRDIVSPLPTNLSDSKDLTQSRTSTKSEMLIDGWFGGRKFVQEQNVSLDVEGVTFAIIEPQYNEIATLCLKIAEQITSSTNSEYLQNIIAPLCVDEANDHMTDLGRALIKTGNCKLIIQKPPSAKIDKIEEKNLYCIVKKTETGTIVEKQGLIAAMLMDLRGYLLKKD